MIFDVVKRSLASPRVLIPVEQLLGDAQGSRLPEVCSTRLTAAVARRVVEACPTAALAVDQVDGRLRLRLNYGECIGCSRCIAVGEGAFVPATCFTRCGVAKSGLVGQWDLDPNTPTPGEGIVEVEPAMEAAGREIRRIVGRALDVREVDAGSCNGCEAEIVALNNPYYDLERFNIHFVASPKHADMLLVTGPVTQNMAEAVRQTYAATPAPKLVVAVGACGCSGGMFAGSHAVAGPVDAIIPVDGYIPGCPPTPSMLLTGILQVIKTVVGR